MDEQDIHIRLDGRIRFTILILLLIGAAFFGRSVLPKAVAAVSSGEKKLPIYSVDTEEKKISISFDAAWGNEDTGRILQILEKHDVKATFFMTGGWIEKYAEDVKKIAAAGHDLANHSENHLQMSKLGIEACKEELMEPHNKVKELTGVDMTLFRAPYGDYNNTLMDAAAAVGYHVIQWDVDSLDWKDYGADAILNKVVNHKNLKNGSIILCHNGAKYTADALESLLVALKEKGYTFVPISELIYTDHYSINHEGRQIPNQ